MDKLKGSEVSEILNLLEVRIFAYHILKSVFMAEPRKEMISQFKNGIINHFPFKDENNQLKEGIALVNKYFEKFDMDEDFELLHWDYTRMFIGPYELPVHIWESAYTSKDGLLFQEETLEVRRLYLKYNLISKQYDKEADDHLGLELDYMNHLGQLAFNLMKKKKIKEVENILLDQEYFLKNHLLNWTPDFSERVVKNSETGFYQGMAKILNGFLLVDKACLEEILTEVNLCQNS